ncbi:MAG: PQQ-dependent sugar dehydrogenase [Acidimicrobiia bacterium]|nr:PQQ-dependent sugar dehydrogenase [Acidimicrobiia bacterium]
MIFTERPGRISARLGDGTVRQLAGGPTDVRSTGGEGGLLGLALHPAFGFLNRWVYACFASTAGDVRVARWSLDPAFTTLSGRVDVVTGMPHNAASDGRHSGCRPRFGPDGFLWIGTGDAATGGVAQDLGSPGGKVLRVDAEGNPAPGNPFPGSRVYTYGHRNVQGLAFQPGTGRAYSVEHGPTRDDEVNLLVAGADYGWAPPPGGYDESVPMTRPGATGAVWSSGSRTLATSGGTFLDGPQWKAWDGALVVACLKSRQVVLFVPNFLGGFSAPQTILTGYGRLRTPVQGPDGSLYVTTSDSGNDRVLRVTPG